VALATGVALAVAFALPISSAAALFVFGGIYVALIGALRAIPFEVINALLRRSPPTD
jgi:hypothetical protein